MNMETMCQGGMASKLIGTFVCNFIAAIALAVITQRAGIVTVCGGLRLGAVAGIGFSVTAISFCYLWVAKPLKVWLIDASYNVVGCLAMGAILTAWH